MLRNKLIVFSLIAGFMMFAGSVSAQTETGTIINSSKPAVVELISRLLNSSRLSNAIQVKTPSLDVFKPLPGDVARPGVTPRRCLPGDVYDRQTGARCRLWSVVLVCTGDDIFNAHTGERCVQSGVVENDDKAVKGSTYHPADTNRDYRIDLSEVTAYAASHGPNDPNVIWATDIWRRGEVYRLWDY